MKKYGHLPLSRKQFAGDDLLWNDGTTFDTRSAWTWLLQAAAWKDGEYHTAFRLDQLKRGEFVASLRYLGERWKWSKNTVSRFLAMLEKAGRITRQRKGQHGMVYLLVNYESYNGDGVNSGTAKGTLLDTPKGRARDKVEEGKEVKNKNLVTSGDVTGEYPAEFELLWNAYPKRSGTNNKQAAYRQYVARLAEGISFQVMHDGVLRYNAWVVASAMVGTRTVLMAATFLGRDKHFLEPYDLPAATWSGAPPTRADVLYEVFTARGFAHLSSVQEIEAAIERAIADGVAGDRDSFTNEVRAVRPWTWMRTLRPQDKKQAVEKIAQKLAAPALAVVA